MVSVVFKDVWVLYFFGGCLLATTMDLRRTKKNGSLFESLLKFPLVLVSFSYMYTNGIGFNTYIIILLII